MTDLLLLQIDEVVEPSPLDADILLAMMPSVSSSRPTSELIEAIWYPEKHPRWPPGTHDVDGKDIAGEFMRAGQTFMHNGQRWDIHSVADGRIIANEASGNIDKVETRVFTPQQIEFPNGEKHPTIKGAEPAPPVKLTSGKSHGTSDMGYTAPIVDGVAGNADHDPKIPIPATSKFTEADWEKFGLADQLYYTEVMSRYGEWTQQKLGPGNAPVGSKVQQVFAKATKEFGSSDPAQLVQSAINSQKGSSSGTELNLVDMWNGVSSGSAALKTAQKKYARAREVQSEVNGAIAWDLYNRLKAPDVSVRHKAPQSEGFFSTIVAGKHAVMSGLSTAWSTGFNWGETSTLGLALPIRHIQLAENVTGLGWNNPGHSEFEIATSDRVKVSPDTAAYWSPSQVPEHGSAPLWTWLKKQMSGKPAPGSVMKKFAAHLSGKEELPDVVADPNFEPKHVAGGSTLYVIPPDEFMKQVEQSIADDPGVGVGEKKPISELGLKPGDIFYGASPDFRYMMIEDPGLPKGTIRYVALQKGAPGNYDSPDKLYTTSGQRTKVNKHFDIPAPKAVKKREYTPSHWIPSGEPVKLGKMQVGDKFRAEGQDWEITNQSSTQTTVKSLTDKQQGTFNPLWKTQVLKRLAEAKPQIGSTVLYKSNGSQYVGTVTAENEDTFKGTFMIQTPTGLQPPPVNPQDISPLPVPFEHNPEKGDVFHNDGKKFVVTTVLKDGTVKAKPSIGKVQAFKTGDPALQHVFRPSAFQLGTKQKIGDFAVGELMSGSMSNVHPYMKIDGASVQNLETGEVSQVSSLKKYTVLTPVANVTAEEAPTTGMPWGASGGEPPKFKLGDSLKGHKYMELELGDMFTTPGGTTFQITDTTGTKYYTVKSTATGNETSVNHDAFASPNSKYAGNALKPTVPATPAPQFKVGDPLKGHLYGDLQPGDQFQNTLGTWVVSAADPENIQIKKVGTGTLMDKPVGMHLPPNAKYAGNTLQAEPVSTPGQHPEPGASIDSWADLEPGDVVSLSPDGGKTTFDYQILFDKNATEWEVKPLETGSAHITSLEPFSWKKATAAPTPLGLGLIYKGKFYDQTSQFKPGDSLKGTTIGDLKVGDQFVAAGSNIMVYTVGPGGDELTHDITWQTADGELEHQPYPKAQGTPSSWEYVGHESIGEPKFNDPLLGYTFGDLKPGDKIKTIGDSTIYTVAPGDDDAHVKLTWAPKKFVSYAKSEPVAGGFEYKGYAPPVELGPQATGDKDAVKDGGFKPFKSNAGPGGKYKHDKLQDMPAGSVLVDSGGKPWKLISKQPDDNTVLLSDGSGYFMADGKLRGKLAVHSKKPVNFVDNMSVPAVEPVDEPEPVSSPETIDTTVGEIPLPAGFVKPGPDVPLTAAGNVVPSALGLQVGDEFISKTGTHYVINEIEPLGPNIDNYHISKLGGGSPTVLEKPIVKAYKKADPTIPPGVPGASEQPASIFRESSKPPVLTANLPPSSLIKLGGGQILTKPLEGPWVGLGSDTPYPGGKPAVAKQVFPIVPDTTGWTISPVKVDPFNSLPGEMFGSKASGIMYMILGGGPAGIHVLKMSDKSVGFLPHDKKIEAYELQAPSTPPKFDPEPPAEEEVPDVPEGFTAVSPGTDASNAGLEVGDAFFDSDGDLHTVYDTGTNSEGDYKVKTKYVMQHGAGGTYGPSWWGKGISVTAIKKAPQNVEKPAAENIPEGFGKLSHPIDFTQLVVKPGDQLIDTDGDEHTVTDVTPLSVTTSWEGKNGKASLKWGPGSMQAVAVKKISPKQQGDTVLAPDQGAEMSTTTPAVPDQAAAIPDYSNVKLSNGSEAAGGTTGAVNKIGPEGKKWLVKTYGGDENRVATELLANAVYRTMGLKAAVAGKRVENGKQALTYPLVDGHQEHFSVSGKTPKKVALGKGFMTDALVNNWDFAGLVDDNVLWNGDEPTRIDQGGTFYYRAQGKPKEFPPDPSGDIKNLLTMGQGNMGVHVTVADLKEQANKIGQVMTPAKVDELVAQAGFDSSLMAENVAANLKSRVTWMKHFAAGNKILPQGLDIPLGEPGPKPKPSTAASGFSVGQTLDKTEFGQLAIGDVVNHDTAGDYQVVGKTKTKAQLAHKDAYTMEHPLNIGLTSKMGPTYTYLGNKPLPTAAPEPTPEEFAQVPEMPIEPYTSKWASGGKFSYPEISELSPGQTFVDKKGTGHVVKGVIHNMQHVGETPANGKDNTTYAFNKTTAQIVEIPHTFLGTSGAKKGKTLPTRVKLES